VQVSNPNVISPTAPGAPLPQRAMISGGSEVQVETMEAKFLKIVQDNSDEESAALSRDKLKQIFTMVIF
jgi:hypothetical protein